MSNNDQTNLNGDHHAPEELAAAEITALALGQLHGDERASLERRIGDDRGDLNAREIDEIRSIADALTSARTSEPLPERSPALRERLQERLTAAPKAEPAKRRPTVRRWAIVGGAVAASLLVGVILLPAIQARRAAARRAQASNQLHNFGFATQNYHDTFAAAPGEILEVNQDTAGIPAYAGISGATNHFSNQLGTELSDLAKSVPMPPAPIVDPSTQVAQEANGTIVGFMGRNIKEPGNSAAQLNEKAAAATEQERLNDALTESQALASAKPRVPYAPMPGGSVARGYAEAEDVELANPQMPGLRIAASAEATRAKRAKEQRPAVERAQLEKEQAGRVAGLSASQLRKDEFNRQKREADRKAIETGTDRREAVAFGYQVENSEQYATIYENAFLSPLTQPLSTFSIDVDTASYANTRRFLTSNRLPPRNAVRIEELVNYFRYDYPQPKAGQPFSVNMEVAECPWREGHLVLRVGLKGKDIERAKRPASNLVFLLDVSGSMSDENKLPLLKTAMKLLVGELGENDRVSIVTYAGDAGLKLPSARGHEQKKINATIDSLSAGGSTNGSAGIELAYEQATAHFITGGTNRVILCTDGDLNVGITSDEALVKLIKDKAKSGVFLTVLGFGEGNLKDAKMERLADNGNGLYAYIDSVREAKKVLVEQLTGSTITIAKDVKIQIEFNPAQIAAYRLLGYENRILDAQDFNNDKKDAGEIGAGHTVTALYELVPVGAIEKPEPQQPNVDPLKYQGTGNKGQETGAFPGGFGGGEGFGGGGFGGGIGGGFGGGFGGGGLGGATPTHHSPLTTHPASPELLTLKLRYKQPTADISQLLEFPLQDRGGSFNSASPDFQFAASVASFGMVLRQSQYRGSSNLAAVEEIASGALGADAGGYRAEFVDLVRKAQTLGAR